MIRKVALSRDGAEAFISSWLKDKWTCRATFVWNVPTHHGGIRLSMLWHRSADSTRTSQDTNGPVFNSVYNLGFKWRSHPLFATFRLIQLPAASPSLPRLLTLILPARYHFLDSHLQLQQKRNRHWDAVWNENENKNAITFKLWGNTPEQPGLTGYYVARTLYKRPGKAWMRAWWHLIYEFVSHLVFVNRRRYVYPGKPKLLFVWTRRTAFDLSTVADSLSSTHCLSIPHQPRGEKLCSNISLICCETDKCVWEGCCPSCRYDLNIGETP